MNLIRLSGLAWLAVLISRSGENSGKAICWFVTDKLYHFTGGFWNRVKQFHRCKNCQSCHKVIFSVLLFHNWCNNSKCVPMNTKIKSANKWASLKDSLQKSKTILAVCVRFRLVKTCPFCWLVPGKGHRWWSLHAKL